MPVSAITQLAINNPASGEEDIRPIGVEAQNSIVSFDRNGEIIEDINDPSVIVSSTKSVAEVFKDVYDYIDTTIAEALSASY